MMICTECNKTTNRTTSAYWHKGSWIVGKDESICDECLQARVGYTGADILYKLHEEKEKEMNDENRSFNK